jgi:hypothetical protein
MRLEEMSHKQWQRANNVVGGCPFTHRGTHTFRGMIGSKGEMMGANEVSNHITWDWHPLHGIYTAPPICNLIDADNESIC